MTDQISSMDQLSCVDEDLDDCLEQVSKFEAVLHYTPPQWCSGTRRLGFDNQNVKRWYVYLSPVGAYE